MKSIVKICALLALLPASMFGQAFYIATSAGASSSVSRLPSGASGDSQGSSSSEYIDPLVQGGAYSLNSSAQSSFVASGVTARGNASAQSTASGSLFGLQVSGSAFAEYPQQNPNSALGSQFFGYGASGGASSGALLQVYDLIFSGPDSAFLGSLNLNLEGFQNNVWVQTYLSQNGGLLYTTSGNGMQYYYSSGNVNSSDFYGSYIIPTGVPISLYINLSGSTGVDVRYGDSPTSSSYSGSVHLPFTGDIFNLPDGYTVNSVSAQIVDNRFTAVPEPSEYAMIGALGAVGAVAWRRRQQKRLAA